jgi:hypothetical protein
MTAKVADFADEIKIKRSPLYGATDEQRLSLSTLRNLQFPLANGRTVPLGQFATLDFGQEFPLIWRPRRGPDANHPSRRVRSLPAFAATP